MGNLSRGYLNADERNVYMVAKSFVDLLGGKQSFEGKAFIKDEVWKEWNKHGMMTPEMQKNLKLTRTYLRKFILELEKNLDAASMERLNKMFANFEYKLIDDYTVQKLMRKSNDKNRYVSMKVDLFQDLIIEISELRCVGCKNCDYGNCEIYHAFEDVSLSYVGEETNCPYACDLSTMTDKQIKKVNNLKQRLKNKNIFFKDELSGGKDNAVKR